VPDPGQTRAYLALTLISALWGSYPAFAKLALAHFPPYVLVSLRCTLASAFLTVLLFRRGWEEFRELRADLRTFAFLGLPMMLVAAPFFPRPDFTSQTAWLVVLYQAFLGAVAHVWWYEGVKAVGPSRAAIFMNLQPVVGLLLAWVMLHEAVEWPEVVGGALVLLGVALTTQAPLPPRAAS
jgi:drug/metabolite transporter (DMT)-like permease